MAGTTLDTKEHRKMSIGIKKWSCAGYLHTRIDLYKQGNRISVCSMTFAQRTPAKPDTTRRCYILW
jgi:hypothetical protein